VLHLSLVTCHQLWEPLRKREMQGACEVMMEALAKKMQFIGSCLAAQCGDHGVGLGNACLVYRGVEASLCRVDNANHTNHINHMIFDTPHTHTCLRLMCCPLLPSRMLVVNRSHVRTVPQASVVVDQIALVLDHRCFSISPKLCLTACASCTHGTPGESTAHTP
jgi:hypothetical protein